MSTNKHTFVNKALHEVFCSIVRPAVQVAVFYPGKVVLDACFHERLEVANRLFLLEDTRTGLGRLLFFLFVFFLLLLLCCLGTCPAPS